MTGEFHSPDVQPLSLPDLVRSRGAGILTPILRDLLDRGVEVRLRLTGRSMSPAIDDGDVVTVIRVSLSSIGTGDILMTASPAGRLLVHRVIGVTLTGVRTMGDRLASADPVVSADGILGKVVRVERRQVGKRPQSIDLTSGKSRMIGWITALRDRAKWRLMRARVTLSRFVPRRARRAPRTSPDR